MSLITSKAVKTERDTYVHAQFVEVTVEYVEILEGKLSEGRPDCKRT